MVSLNPRTCVIIHENLFYTARTLLRPYLSLSKSHYPVLWVLLQERPRIVLTSLGSRFRNT